MARGRRGDGGAAAAPEARVVSLSSLRRARGFRTRPRRRFTFGRVQRRGAHQHGRHARGPRAGTGWTGASRLEAHRDGRR